MKRERLPLSTKTLNLIMTGEKKALIFRNKKYTEETEFFIRGLDGKNVIFKIEKIKEINKKEIHLYASDLGMDMNDPVWEDYLNSSQKFYIYYIAKKERKGFPISIEAPVIEKKKIPQQESF